MPHNPALDIELTDEELQLVLGGAAKSMLRGKMTALYIRWREEAYLLKALPGEQKLTFECLNPGELKLKANV